MRCPFCDHEETQVKDSRPSADGSAIRRRRACPVCEQRFTTFERVQLREMTVLKSDGRRQPFDQDKIVRSMQLALQKRPVELDEIERVVVQIVRQLEKRGEAEIGASAVGAAVMDHLKSLDPIGYIRYASVYKDFNDLDDFLDELKTISQAAGQA